MSSHAWTLFYCPNETRISHSLIGLMLKEDRPWSQTAASELNSPTTDAAQLSAHNIKIKWKGKIIKEISSTWLLFLGYTTTLPLMCFVIVKWSILLNKKHEGGRVKPEYIGAWYRVINQYSAPRQHGKVLVKPFTPFSFQVGVPVDLYQTPMMHLQATREGIVPSLSIGLAWHLWQLHRHCIISVSNRFLDVRVSLYY